MKNLMYLLLFMSSVSFAATHATSIPFEDEPKVGDVLKIKSPKHIAFKHIDFPRLNYIVKRGGLPNYKSVYGELVVVKKITTDDGRIQVVLERKDGGKFFRYLKQVTADYTESIEAGEIVKVE